MGTTMVVMAVEMETCVALLLLAGFVNNDICVKSDISWVNNQKCPHCLQNPFHSIWLAPLGTNVECMTPWLDDLCGAVTDWLAI